jgi:type IV pilus assembly protein PilX
VRKYQQQGATLAISLLLLLIITLLGISALSVTQMQERMSSNFQDKTLSFTAAESALYSGENWILNLTTLPAISATCSQYPCVQTEDLAINWTNKNQSWWNSHSAAYANHLTDVTTSPRYTIEFIQFVPDSPMMGTITQSSAGTYYFKITSRGTGGSDTTETILQTTIARRF